MTNKEVKQAVQNGDRVIYKGNEYFATGIIARFGRQTGMAPAVPDRWWYQVELTDVRSAAGAVVIARLEEIEATT